MKNERGFTYLEILATMFIMTLALIPIMRIMPEGMRATRGVERLTKANFLAQSKMEEIREKVLSNRPPPDYGFAESYTQSATAFPNPHQKFKFTIDDNYEIDTSDMVKIINVTVWFDENDNDVIDTPQGPYEEDEISVSLDTKIADRG